MAGTPALQSSATETQQQGSPWAQAQELARQADLEAKFAEKRANQPFNGTFGLSPVKWVT